MFLGQYDHSLEEKGRLLIPKTFRGELGQGGVVTKGLDGCLFVYPKENWEKLIEKLAALPLTKNDARAFSRLFTYGAVEVWLDRVGRILIPQYLRDYASVKSQVTIAGNLDKFEIWDKSKFTEYENKIEKNSNEISEAISELGI